MSPHSKMMHRLPESLHQRLREKAARERLSLNQMYTYLMAAFADGRVSIWTKDDGNVRFTRVEKRPEDRLVSVSQKMQRSRLQDACNDDTNLLPAREAAERGISLPVPATLPSTS